MTITIHNTSQIINVETTGPIKCRVWEGTTERGTKVTVLIPRIAVAPGEDQDAFATELEEQKAPIGVPTETWPLWMII